MLKHRTENSFYFYESSRMGIQTSQGKSQEYNEGCACHANGGVRYMILTLESQQMMCQLRSMGSGGLNQVKVEEELPGKRLKQSSVSSNGP